MVIVMYTLFKDLLWMAKTVTISFSIYIRNRQENGMRKGRMEEIKRRMPTPEIPSTFAFRFSLLYNGIEFSMDNNKSNDQI